MQKTILLTGATGLVGSALSRALRQAGHDVTALSRGPSWNPGGGQVDASVLEGVDVVVHLAGEPIAARRWSTAQKQRIRDSRVRGTRALAEALAANPRPGRAFVCASAIGYYGNRGEEALTEMSALGEGFLAEVVRDWEDAAAPAQAAGLRVVFLRLGVVLSAQGGALAKMLPAFRLGLGGPLGNGRDWMSWIHLDDAVAAFQRAVDDAALDGAYNFCAPLPVRNREFTRALGQVLRRPAVMPVPRLALRLLLGEMGETLLLHSARVLPRRLQEEAEFHFAHPELLPALRDLLRD